MSDDSKPPENEDGADRNDEAARIERKFKSLYMVFGKDQTAQQIADQLNELPDENSS